MKGTSHCSFRCFGEHKKEKCRDFFFNCCWLSQNWKCGTDLPSAVSCSDAIITVGKEASDTQKQPALVSVPLSFRSNCKLCHHNHRRPASQVIQLHDQKKMQMMLGAFLFTIFSTQDVQSAPAATQGVQSALATRKHRKTTGKRRLDSIKRRTNTWLILMLSKGFLPIMSLSLIA